MKIFQSQLCEEALEGEVFVFFFFVNFVKVEALMVLWFWVLECFGFCWWVFVELSERAAFGFRLFLSFFLLFCFVGSRFNSCSVCGVWWCFYVVFGSFWPTWGTLNLQCYSLCRVGWTNFCSYFGKEVQFYIWIRNV